MLTIKQLETFVKIVELGTFDRAAQNLHATQSTISKRISELESASGLQLFDRAKRTARLTEDGERLLGLAKDTLYSAKKIMEIRGDAESTLHRVRVGITDLTALTWLPNFLQESSRKQPEIKLELAIDMSRTLYQMFQDDDLDLIVIPLASDALSHIKAKIVQLKRVEVAFMANSDIVNYPAPVPIRELEQFKILGQGKQSAYAQNINKWLFEQGVQITPTMIANNLLALVGLISAGHGIAVLPKKCMLKLSNSTNLKEVETVPKLPDVVYYIIYKDEARGKLLDKIAKQIEQTADFTKPFFV